LALLAALFLPAREGLLAVETRAPSSSPLQDWSGFFAAPAATPLLTALGLPTAPNATQAGALGVVLSAAGLTPGELANVAPAAGAALVHGKAQTLAASASASWSPREVALLAVLAPSQADRLLSVRRAAGERVDEALLDWAPRGADSVATVAARGHSGLAPSREERLPFLPTRALRLDQVGAAVERAKTSAVPPSEESYRSMNPADFLNGVSPSRLDTLLRRQAADRAQAALELVSNGLAAGRRGLKKIGRFGVGGMQVLGELEGPDDRVVLETSKGDGHAAQFIFWRRGEDILFDYRVVASARRGTTFQVHKKLGEAGAERRRRFLADKLALNDQGPIEWAGGGRINHPEEYREWGGERPRAAEGVPPVAVRVDANGYEVVDRGSGMGLKEVFELYLKPYATSNTVPPTDDPARLLFRETSADFPSASLGLSTVRLERVALDEGGRRLNMAGDVFIDLPHDTEITEERSSVVLVPADQSMTPALRGLRAMIDRLTDSKISGDGRFALLNSVAELIRRKQPAGEKGLSSGDMASATDLLWYLRAKLDRSGLLTRHRQAGGAFLPNDARWGALEGVNPKIIFLDRDLLGPTAADFEAAGFEPLPAGLAQRPAWQAFKTRIGVPIYAARLRASGAIAVVDPAVVVLDRSVLNEATDVDVLIARLEREMKREAKKPEAATPPSRVARLRRRLLIPAIVAVAAMAAPNISHVSHWAHSRYESAFGQSYQASADLALGNPRPVPAGDIDPSQTPKSQFGEFSPPEAVEGLFVSGVATRLSGDGTWSVKAGPWSQRDWQNAKSIHVHYRLAFTGTPQRLLNLPNGVITMTKAPVADGLFTQEPVASWKFDPSSDALTLDQTRGSVEVDYDVAVHAKDNGVEDAEQPLPPNEVRDFPRLWAARLDSVRGAADAEKVKAISALMKRDFVYDYQAPFVFDGVSWSHTANAYLQQGRPIPIICNTSSLYYYMMARYVGLPAAYEELVVTDHGRFYQDMVGHARAGVRVDGAWKNVETTSLMNVVHPAPRVVPTGGRSWFHGLGFNPLNFPVESPAFLIILGAIVMLAAAFFALQLRPIAAALRQMFHVLLDWSNSTARYRERRRLLGPFRAALARLAGWRGLKQILETNAWAPALGREARRHAHPWGAHYESSVVPERVIIEDAAGRLRTFRKSLVAPEVVERDGAIYFVDNFNLSVVGFDGRRLVRFRPAGMLRGLRLLETPGAGPYVRAGNNISRLDMGTGLPHSVGSVPNGLEFNFVGSDDGVDYFATKLQKRKGREHLGSLSISKEGLRLAEAVEVVFPALDASLEWKTWRVDGAVVHELFDKKKPYSKEGAFTIVPDSGRAAVTVAIQGRVLAAAGQSVIAANVDAVFGKERRWNIARGRWEDLKIEGEWLGGLRKVGPGLFQGFSGEIESFHQCIVAEDQSFAVKSQYRAEAAVKIGDTVFYRMDLPWVLFASSKNEAERFILLSGAASTKYSEACAAATGLPASAFAALDRPDKGGARARVFSPFADPAASKSALADVGFLETVDEALREALPYRVASMPRWSPGRLFLKPETARSPTISPKIEECMDRLVRANGDHLERLPELFELIERAIQIIDASDTYNHGRPNSIGGFVYSEVIAHYVDIVTAVPEFAGELRAAVLEPLARSGRYREVPLGFLSRDEAEWSGFPITTQVFLRLLRDGADSLLRREADSPAPAGSPAAQLATRGASIGRLIAAARSATAAELDEGGLSSFAQAHEALEPQAAADLASIQGVARGQGISAPVWIRELVQNARDAVREGLRHGRAVAAKVDIRSYLSEDGARWTVSVRDGLGMPLSRLIKKMLIPDASTKTVASEIEGVLAMPGTTEEKAGRVLMEFFDAADSADPSLRAELISAAAGPTESAAKLIAERWSEKIKKAGAGFFGIGFFTVFGGADDVLVRTGENGFVREARLTPVRDVTGKLVDIRVEDLTEHADPEGRWQGTEVRRVKAVTPDNLGKILVENAYLGVMTHKYAGAVSDVGISFNGEPAATRARTVGERGGVRSQLDPGIPRWTVDELFIQEPPTAALSLIPPEDAALLRSAGWNLAFPARRATVRTRNSVLDPAADATIAAALSLPASFELYRADILRPAGLVSYGERLRISPWDRAPLPADILRDAAAIDAEKDTPELWKRYSRDSRKRTELMLAVCDAQEAEVRRLLGPALSAQLDAVRVAGEPLRVGRLPLPSEAGYAETLRRLHTDALARSRGNAADPFSAEPAMGPLAAALGSLAEFLDSPPNFVPVDSTLCRAASSVLNGGPALPLMEAFLVAAGRSGDRDAVALFEGWLREPGAGSRLRELLGGDDAEGAVRKSLAVLQAAAARDMRPFVSLRSTKS
jgi:hypothetical protein